MQQQQQKSRRAKDLLRNYYGLADVEKKQVNPLDIDSNSFEPEKYFNKLVTEKQLSELIQQDNDLITEIRQLNGDMETLVYENYNKFISATDTIQKMRSNVEAMESEMDQLTKNVSNMSNISREVESALGPKRDKSRKLAEVHESLTNR
ncbi:7736_t:CDS:1 [Ambispora gerdemannii]|uniref:Vacuolar protein sorting-associated protein 51 homolog n=1 Tax=Ambispora gerdemannii TaxID=144530 RepID=A0A9N9FGB2_9GLOM|nr:7736_t:CDS:1 [Ambispora gerdemannii]